LNGIVLRYLDTPVRISILTPPLEGIHQPIDGIDVVQVKSLDQVFFDEGNRSNCCLVGSDVKAEDPVSHFSFYQKCDAIANLIKAITVPRCMFKYRPTLNHLPRLNPRRCRTDLQNSTTAGRAAPCCPKGGVSDRVHRPLICLFPFGTMLTADAYQPFCNVGRVQNKIHATCLDGAAWHSKKGG
jgi:hypothetical protein